MTLSDKIEYCEDYNLRGQDDVHPAVLADVILVKDVKEAIKELKDLLVGQEDRDWLIPEINKIFGEELCE